MDDQRIGRSLRVLRRRRQLRQSDVAVAAHVSQSLVSQIEAGRLAGLTLGTLKRVFAAVDAGFEGDVLWRGPALDRLIDADHARLVGVACEGLRRSGWDPIRIEASYSEFGERGSIDVLGGRPVDRAVVIEEVKTSLVSIESTLRKLDEKTRLVAERLCGTILGFEARYVGRILILPDDTTARRAVLRHAQALDVALPDRGLVVRRWLRSPSGSLRGILFLPVGSGAVSDAARQRVHPRSDPGYR